MYIPPHLISLSPDFAQLFFYFLVLVPKHRGQFAQPLFSSCWKAVIQQVATHWPVQQCKVCCLGGRQRGAEQLLFSTSTVHGLKTKHVVTWAHFLLPLDREEKACWSSWETLSCKGVKIWIGTLGIVLKLENLRWRKIKWSVKGKMDSDTTLLLQMGRPLRPSRTERC